MPHELFERLLDDIGVGGIRPGEETQRADVTAHSGNQRIGLPPGETKFDWKQGTVTHLDTDTTIEEGIPTLDQVSQVGNDSEDKGQDQHVMRSLLAFTDVGANLTIAGSEVPLDPCSYFPIDRTPHTAFTVETTLPVDLYLVASSRTRPFSELVSMASHTNRIGTYSGTPDSWSAVAWETGDTYANADFGAEARHPALHAQEFGSRTWTVENTGANDAEVRLVGKTTHSGPYVDVEPSSQPVAVASGATETLTLNDEAWHVLKLEVQNTATGNAVELESHYAGVNA